jgi:alpha-beta hydrolase superfamily lysophospholipase
MLTASDGTKIRIREWPRCDALETVLIVHGLGEHMGRYGHVAAQLNLNGFRVVGYDQRGHGTSGGGRAKLQRSDDLMCDLAMVIDAVRATYPGPLVLLGHSMGGAVAAFMVAAATDREGPPWARDVDALMLSSPALQIGMRAGQRRLLSMALRLVPNLAFKNAIDPGWVSRDPEVVRAYVADPLVHDRLTPSLLQFMLDAGAAVRSKAAQWRVPTLLLYAGSDRLVVPAGSEVFAASAPRGVVTAHGFPSLFHEIFNEPEQHEVLSVLTSWLASRPSRER